MARMRDLRPGFFKNEDLAECDPLARLLFAGLWTIADREGRIQDRPKRIKSELLPYDNCDANALLNQLTKFKFIERYEIGGLEFIQVNNFTKHQRVHPKEVPSTIPPPPSFEARTTSKENSIYKTTAEPRKNYKKDGPNRTIPSSPSIPTIPPLPPTPQGGSARFDDFWAAYPKKVGKTKAQVAWNKKKLDTIADKIITAVQRFRQSEQWLKENGKFIPHPLTFITGERWEDQLTTELSTSPPKKNRYLQAWEAGCRFFHEGQSKTFQATQLKPINYTLNRPDKILDGFKMPDGSRYRFDEFILEERIL